MCCPAHLFRWPWERQVDEVRELREQVKDLRTEVNRALSEVSEVSERAYRYLKRAEQRARREFEAPGANQEPGAAAVASGAAPATPRLVPRARNLWGARARRLAREAQPGATIDLDLDEMREPEGERDGTG